MYGLDGEAEDSGLPEDLECTREKAWTEPLAEGIGMAQTSFVSTHHACQA